jgi:hypothetical protein
LDVGIERGGCLVEHDDVRAMQQDAGKGESLLLAPGERLIPWRLLLKTIDEVAARPQTPLETMAAEAAGAAKKTNAA